MRLSFRFPDKRGKITEHIFLGILRQSSLFSKNIETPLIHLKMRHIFKARNMLPGSYNFNEVIRIFTRIPKFELFRTSSPRLLKMVDDLLSITNPNDIYCFTFPKSGNRLPIMAVVPTPLFNHDNVQKVIDYMRHNVPHSEFEVIEIPGDETCRLQFYFDQLDDEGWIPNSRKIEDEVKELIKPWENRFLDAINDQYPGVLGKRLYTYYLSAFPNHYRVRRSPYETVLDVKYLEKMTHENTIQFNLIPFTFRDSVLSGKSSLLTIYNPEKIDLIDMMPILENMGFHVFDELTTRVGTKDHLYGYIHSFRLTDRQGSKFDEDEVKETLVTLLHSIFSRKTENDPLNELCVKCGIDWRAINLLQTYRNFLIQINNSFSKDKINQTLLAHPECSKVLYQFFEEKFSPDVKFGKKEYRIDVLLPRLTQQFLDQLHSVEDVSEDLIFRRLMNLLTCTLRTNFFH